MPVSHLSPFRFHVKQPCPNKETKNGKKLTNARKKNPSLSFLHRLMVTVFQMEPKFEKRVNESNRSYYRRIEGVEKGSSEETKVGFAILD